MRSILTVVMLLVFGILHAQNGRVADKDGTALAGASVTIKGSNRTTITGQDGRFTIDCNAGDILVVTYVGYQQYQRSVTAADLGKEMVVVLQSAGQSLDEVIVGSNVVATKRKEEVSAVTVIDAKTIASSPYQSVDQIFRGMVPGTNSINNGPGDNTSTFTTIRGATTTTGQGNIKVYIDGIEMAYNVNYLSTIDKTMIDRIEIVRGAGAATLYGSGASGGVIQIFTKKGKLSQPKLQLNLAAGPIESDYTKGNTQLVTSANYSGGSGNATYYTSAQYRRVTDILPDADDKFLSFNGGTKVTIDKLTMNFTMQYSQRVMGNATNPIATELNKQGAYPDVSNADKRKDRVDNIVLGANLNYNLFDWWSHTLIVGLDKQTNWFWSTVPDDDKHYSYYYGDYSTPSLRYFSTFKFPSKGFFKSTAIAGFEYSSPDQQSASSYTTLPKGQGIAVPAYSSIIHDYTSNYGYFFQWQPQLGEHIFITSGVRVEKNKLFGPEFGWNGKAVSPRIGITGNFNIGDVVVKPRLSYGKGITAPTTLQRFGRDLGTAVFLPNEDLAPTSQSGYDGGIELFAFNNKLHFEGSYYNQKAKDLIVSQFLRRTSTGISQYQFINLQSVKNTGYEFQADGQLANLELKATFSIVDSRADQLGPNYRGYLKNDNRLMTVAHNLAGLTANYSFVKNKVKKASVSLSASYMSGVRGYAYQAYYREYYGNGNTSADVNNYIITYPSVTRFNLSADYHLRKNLLINVQVLNLFNNKRFEYSDFFPVQQRSWLFGISYTL